MCLVLGASFLIIGAAFKSKLQASPTETLRRTDTVMSRLHARHKSRTRRPLAALSEQSE